MLKLKDKIGPDENGYSIEYSVHDGAIWISFLGSDGYGCSIVAEEKEDVWDFFDNCYKVQTLKHVLVEIWDNLSTSHTLTLKMNDDNKVLLTHESEGVRWQMNLELNQLLEIPASFDGYFY